MWLANRGVWEAIVGAGPVCSVPATDEDVDAYLAGWDEFSWPAALDVLGHFGPTRRHAPDGQPGGDQVVRLAFPARR